MDVTKKDAVCPGCVLTKVKSQSYDIPEKSRVFEGLDGGVQVTFIRKVDAFQYSPFRVKQITFIALAGEAVVCQAAVGAGTRPAAAAQVEAQLLAAPVTPGTRVGAYKSQHMPR